jgi:hypothetical protein
MKRLGLIALLCCFASCKDGTIVTDLRGTGDEAFDRIYHFEYKSHEYILFRKGLGNNAIAGVVHDPDCKCKEEIK